MMPRYHTCEFFMSLRSIVFSFILHVGGTIFSFIPLIFFPSDLDLSSCHGLVHCVASKFSQLFVESTLTKQSVSESFHSCWLMKIWNCYSFFVEARHVASQGFSLPLLNDIEIVSSISSLQELAKCSTNLSANC